MLITGNQKQIRLFLLILSITLLFSCTQKQERSYDYVRYRIKANPTSLDPAYIVDVTGGTIAAKIFNGLVKLDGNMNVTPDIAKEWEVSKDGRTYRFFLRDDVFFHNKRKVRAEDIKHSFTRILSPGTGSPNTWVLNIIKGANEYLNNETDEIEGIKIIDHRTVELELKTPFSPFLKLLTMPAAYIIPEDEARTHGKDFGSQPTGTGPFYLDRWDHNNRLKLSKNEKYFGASPKVEGVVYRIIPEDITAVTEFLLGNIDILEIPMSAYSMFVKDEEYSNFIESATGLNTYYLGFNTLKPPLNNSKVRKAIAFAIDRDRILDAFYQGRGRPAAGPVPDALRSYSVFDINTYDPAKAKALLLESGYTGDITLNFYITATQEAIDMAEVIESYLKKAGINVNIRSIEWSAYKVALNEGEAHLFWLSWWADYPDEENFLFPLFHSSNFGPGGNRMRYKNETVDNLINRARVSTDDSERSQLFKKAENIIINELPCLFFWHKNDYIVKQPWIRDYKIYPVYSIDKGEYLSIDINNFLQQLD